MFPQLKPGLRIDQLPPQMQAEATLLLVEAGRHPREVAKLTGLWPGDAVRRLSLGPFRRGNDFNSTRPKDDAE